VIDRGLILLTGLRLRLEGGRLLPWQRAARMYPMA
jgi:hypothetical protein